MLCLPIVAHAQDAPALRVHQFTFGGGLLSSGAYDVGDSTAQLRGNGNTAPTFTLFTANSRITSALSPELHVGFAVTRRIAAEFSFAVSHPQVGVSIASDPEAPSQELVGERLNQYAIGGGVTWQPPLRFGSRLAPFLSGGAAFLRQLHEDRTLAETGRVYYAGGGARYFLRGGSGAGRVFGLRGDARLNFRTKGIDFEDRIRTYPTFGLSAFIGF